MNNLTDHQWAIMVAMLQGKDIELDHSRAMGYDDGSVWSKTNLYTALHCLANKPDLVRIAPGQDDDVTLYGQATDTLIEGYDFSMLKSEDDTHKITISKNGTIVGGKLGVER